MHRRLIKLRAVKSAVIAAFASRRAQSAWGFLLFFGLYHRLLQVRLVEYLHFHGIISQEGQLFKVFRWLGAAGHDWQIWARLDQTQSDGYLAGWFSTPLTDRPYTSKFGAGDWLLTSLVATISDRDRALRLLYTVLALATSLVILISARFVANKFALIVAAAWCGGLTLPWSLQMWSSAWWNFPLRYLPILLVPFYFLKNCKSRFRRCLALAVALNVVLLSEYILFTLTFFGCLGLIFTVGILEGKCWGFYRINLVDFLISVSAATLSALGIHLVQLRLLTGSWRSGLNEFAFNAMKRVSSASVEGFYGPGSENLRESREFGLGDAVSRILETQVFGLTGMPGLAWLSVGVLGGATLAVAFFCRLGWRKSKVSVTASAAEAWFISATGGWLVWALLVPSWFIHLEFARGVTFFAWVPASFGLLVIRVKDLSLKRQHSWQSPCVGLRLSVASFLVAVALALVLRILTQ